MDFQPVLNGMQVIVDAVNFGLGENFKPTKRELWLSFELDLAAKLSPIKSTLLHYSLHTCG